MLLAATALFLLPLPAPQEPSADFRAARVGTQVVQVHATFKDTTPVLAEVEPALCKLTAGAA